MTRRPTPPLRRVDELRQNLEEVVAMLLENGEPKLQVTPLSNLVELELAKDPSPPFAGVPGFRWV